MPLLERHEEDIYKLCESLPDYREGDRPPGYYFNPGRYGYVVELKGHVIAYTVWSYYPQYIMWDETVVGKDYKGLGLGKRLMHLRDTFSPDPVFGSCHEDNEVMIGMLLKMGFHKCQIIPIAKDRPSMHLYARGHTHG